MEKTRALASLGQRGLLLPAWIKAALTANDRLKLYLSVLQAAAAHAEHPEREALDLSREMAAAGVEAPWVRDLPMLATPVEGALLVPELPRLAACLGEDLGTMARPLLETEAQGGRPDQAQDQAQDEAHNEAHNEAQAGEPRAPAGALAERVRHWTAWLAALRDERLAPDQLHALTSGKRGHGADADSLHLLVMDLHRQLNRLAASLASEEIDGAHVWQLGPEDRAHVAAFMRGLKRTAPLKFDHPGLDTAATRDGERLLIQNDIGTNDAHVLVLQVQDRTITLTYSDLHRARFEFFRSLLAPFGAQWSVPQSKVDAALNRGAAYTLGTARFDCADAAALDSALAGIAANIVFLIDWNRARKRLLPFVGKRDAVELLRDAARLEAGHMGWLKAGGEQLVYAAMQAVGEGAFRIGDRLDAVLGAADARAFLLEVLRLASRALLAGQPPALVADETRLLLARRVRQHSNQFDLLEEHAAYCQTLAQAVADALAAGFAPGAPAPDRAESQALAARAKAWERRADHLVMRAREQARRQPRWEPFVHLLELTDDVADALEEAAFLMGLIADGHRDGWNAEIHEVLGGLARTVLGATREHVKALAIARSLGAGSEAADSDDFLAASWNVLRSERQCDELLRAARRAILGALRDAPALMLANDLALALELASDRLLVAGYALRGVAFEQAEARS